MSRQGWSEQDLPSNLTALVAAVIKYIHTTMVPVGLIPLGSPRDPAEQLSPVAARPNHVDLRTLPLPCLFNILKKRRTLEARAWTGGILSATGTKRLYTGQVWGYVLQHFATIIGCAYPSRAPPPQNRALRSGSFRRTRTQICERLAGPDPRRSATLAKSGSRHLLCKDLLDDRLSGCCLPRATLPSPEELALTVRGDISRTLCPHSQRIPYPKARTPNVFQARPSQATRRSNKRPRGSGRAKTASRPSP